MIRIRVLPPLPGYEADPDGLFHLPGSVNFLGNHEWYVHIAYELEPGEDSQYPLEDLLHEYLVAAEEVPGQGDHGTLSDGVTLNILLAGEPDDLRRCVADIVGKRVYDEDFTLPDGRQAVMLTIAPDLSQPR